MSRPTQFLRIYGYPRGQRSAANTVSSIIAEGLREDSHIRHLKQPIGIEIYTNDASPIEKPEELADWINKSMEQCRYGGSERYPNGRPLRKNAVAIGTMIASLPQKTSETPRATIDDFRDRCIDWFHTWLEERDMLLHAFILHLDEEYPHIHAWFTPNLELIERGEWTLGHVTFPKRHVLKKLQVDFFENVGQYFYGQRAKPASQRRTRLDRKTAIRLRDMPETITSHPIHDIGFFNAVYAMAKLAACKGIEQQTNIMDALKEVLDMEAGISNREALMELIAEHKQMNKKYDFDFLR